MSATIGTLDSILKEFYLGPIEEQLNNETLVIDLFEKATVDWQGKHVIIPIHISRNTTVGFKAETESFDDAGLPGVGNTINQQGYDNLKVTAKFLYGRFQLSGPAIAAAKTGANSFATYVDAEINRLVRDVRNQSNISAVTGGATFGLCWTKAAAAAVPGGTQKEYSGQVAGIATGGANTVTLRLQRTGFPVAGGVNVQLAAIDAGGKSITLGAGVDTSIATGTDTAANPIVAGDVFAVECGTGAVKPAAGANETTGIFGNLFSGSHFDVLRQTGGAANSSAELISTCFTVNKGDVYAALNLDSIQSILDEMLVRAEEEPTMLLMNPVMRVEYTSLLQGVGAANLYKDLSGSQNGDAGFSSLGYAGIPMKVTRHAPKGSIMFLCPKYWRLLELDKKGFADLDGSILSRVAGAGATDAYEGFYKWYYELVCHRPNANAVLTAVDF
jgi:hypothetical protein